MTDTFAITARSPSAAIAWATRDGIFVEYPVRGGGPPYICRYPKTPDGLVAALNVLVENPAPAVPKPQAHPAVRRLASASPESRALAAEVVRKLFR